MKTQTLIDLSNLRFLVADDSRFMRRLVVSVLKAFGVRQITEVATGQAAYNAITQEAYDIVLLDWEFPDRSGESVMRAIRKPDHKGAYQTVIMMSGHDERRRIERALRFGVNGYVAKPVAPATLYQQIRQTVLFPRPYLRTETYFGPKHPLMMQEIEAVETRPEQPVADVRTPAPPKPKRADEFDIDEVSIMV